jgi:AbrB family looped-hinge helix DNA binding protein
MDTYATVKGQIVIPAVLRRKHGIQAGTRIMITDNDEEIILRPVTEGSLRKLQGSLKGTRALQVLMEERQKDQARGK